MRKRDLRFFFEILGAGDSDWSGTELAVDPARRAEKALLGGLLFVDTADVDPCSILTDSEFHEVKLRWNTGLTWDGTFLMSFSRAGIYEMVSESMTCSVKLTQNGRGMP